MFKGSPSAHLSNSGVYGLTQALLAKVGANRTRANSTRGNAAADAKADKSGSASPTGTPSRDGASTPSRSSLSSSSCPATPPSMAKSMRQAVWSPCSPPATPGGTRATPMSRKVATPTVVDRQQEGLARTLDFNSVADDDTDDHKASSSHPLASAAAVLTALIPPANAADVERRIAELRAKPLLEAELAHHISQAGGLLPTTTTASSSASSSSKDAAQHRRWDASGGGGESAKDVLLAARESLAFLAGECEAQRFPSALAARVHATDGLACLALWRISNSGIGVTAERVPTQQAGGSRPNDERTAYAIAGLKSFQAAVEILNAASSASSTSASSVVLYNCFVGICRAACGTLDSACDTLSACCDQLAASAEQASFVTERTCALDRALPCLLLGTLLLRGDAVRYDDALRYLKMAAEVPHAEAAHANRMAAALLLAREAVKTTQKEAAKQAPQSIDKVEEYYELALEIATTDGKPSDVRLVAEEFARELHYRFRRIDKAGRMYERAIRSAKIANTFPRRSQVNNDGPSYANSWANAELLFNAAVCFEQIPAHGCQGASDLYHKALCWVPDNAKETHKASKMRLYFARSLATTGAVDKAMEVYVTVLAAVRQHPEELQVDCNKGRGLLHIAEVKGHIALCLFQRVQDLKGAKKEFEEALQAASEPTVVSVSAGKVKHIKAAPRTVEWLHDGFGALLVRMGLHTEAIPHLEKRIAIAAERKDPAIDTHLQIAAAYEGCDRQPEAMRVYQHLLDLPKEVTSREQRLDTVTRSAWLCHYSLADYRKAFVLYLTALQLETDNPHTMVQAAWCMLQCPEVNISQVGALYENAIIALQSQRAVRQSAAASTPSTPHDIATTRRRDNAQWDRCFVCGECAVFHHDFTKNIKRAQEMYIAALEGNVQSDNLPQVAANYGVLLYHELKQPEEAEKWFKVGTAAAPNHLSAATLYADFLVSTGKYEKAVEELTRAASHGHAEAFHRLAKVEERIVRDGSYDTATVCYCRALGAPSDVAAPTENLVVELFEMVTPQCLTVAHDFLSMIHYKAKNTALTQRLYPIMLEKFPDVVALHVNYAKFNATMGPAKRQKALEHYLRALQLEPSSITVLDHLADFLATADPSRLDVAENFHLQSIALNPDSAQAHFCYACFLTHVYHAPALAEKHFKRALELEPKDTVTLCCYATFLETQMEALGPDWEHYSLALAFAEQMYRDAVNLMPSSASHHVYLASFLWRQKRLTEAWEEFDSAIAADHANVATLRLAGTFLHDWHMSTTGAASAHNNNKKERGLGSSDFTGGAAETQASRYADQLFQRALRLDPRDTATLRAYAKFVDEVKRDSALAQQLAAAAAQIQIETELAHQQRHGEVEATEQQQPSRSSTEAEPVAAPKGPSSPNVPEAEEAKKDGAAATEVGPKDATAKRKEGSPVKRKK